MDQIDVIRYPANVNIKEFLQYMMYPTLTYQDTYPVMNTKRDMKWVGRVIGRAVVIVMTLVSRS